ncbi:MAG TPA: four helix bundle protein [Terriglobales bacterium]|jgi:four helix bundle protein|nr:four helix bundle protein [Terriglobales bacterium]
MDPAELKQRTRKFAVRVFKMADALPRSAASQVIARQVLRSSSSVAANYRSACRARSHAEFIARLGVAEDEADETVFWLEMIIEAGLLPAAKLVKLMDEARQLTAILVASRKTSKRREDRQSAIGDRQ